MEDDSDLAFNLQVEEALNASLLDVTPSNTTTYLPYDAVFGATLSNLIQELIDCYNAELEIKRLSLDLSRQIHDRAFACEILSVPEAEWSRTGSCFNRPYGVAFPKLVELWIQYCALLILPPLSSLRKLLAWHCSSSTLASFSMLYNLADLVVEVDKNMMPNIPIETLENLSNLKRLEISGAHDELSVPEEGTRALKSLTYLTMSNNGILKCLPEGWLCHLIALENLLIDNHRELVELPDGIKYLYNLKHVYLRSLPKMECLPEALQHISLLQSLSVFDLPQLNSLPDWLDNLTSLWSLSIIDCPKLASFPESIQGMLNLKTIEGCPELKRRCEREYGEDWHKISHIPNLIIY